MSLHSCKFGVGVGSLHGIPTFRRVGLRVDQQWRSASVSIMSLLLLHRHAADAFFNPFGMQLMQPKFACGLRGLRAVFDLSRSLLLRSSYTSSLVHRHAADPSLSPRHVANAFVLRVPHGDLHVPHGDPHRHLRWHGFFFFFFS